MNIPYYNPYQPNIQQPSIPQPVQPQAGFVTVHSEDEALRYPIAPGNSITFKVEGQPVIIEKTMGFSQLESPKVERFKLVKEDAPAEVEQPKYALAEDVESIRAKLNRLENELKANINRKRRSDNE